jgi:hypothetical protein
MIEKNCVAFGLNVISGTWSKGYTDSYINVLKATSNQRL